jgi:hypothetical protein
LRRREGKRKKEESKNEHPQRRSFNIDAAVNMPVNEPSKTAPESSPGRKPGDRQQKEISEPAKRAAD